MNKNIKKGIRETPKVTEFWCIFSIKKCFLLTKVSFKNGKQNFSHLIEFLLKSQFSLKKVSKGTDIKHSGRK